MNFDGQQFSVEIPDVKAEPFNAVPSSRICVKYSATLTDGAVFRNTNDAYLEYSNDPKSDGTGRTVGDEVTAFTFTVSFDKVDGKSGDVLEGAGFTLYRKDTDGSYVRFGEEITGGGSFFVRRTQYG